VLVLVLVLAACRTEPIPDDQVNPAPAATLDFSTGSPRDMSVPAGGTGCRALAPCVLECEHNTACAMACLQAASRRARDLFQTAISCIQKHCGALGECVDNGMGFTANPPNAPPGTCQQCLTDGAVALDGNLTCPHADSADCNPIECAMEIDTCAAN
jgi:hypothetical protein